MTLLHKKLSRIDENERHDQTQYAAIAVFDEDAARDYAEFGITFNSHTSDVWLDFARVRYPDGAVRTVAADAVQYKVPGNSIDFTDLRVLSFALPTPTSGSVIEFQISSKARSIPIPGQFFGYWQFHYAHNKFGWNRWRVDPTLRSSFELDMPADGQIVHASHHLRIEPTVQDSSGRRKYTWEASDLPEVVPEEWMEAGINQIPAVWFSSMNRWETIDGWAHELYDPTSNPTETIRALAAKITRRAATPRDKAEALFDFVQKNIRYIAAGFQRGGLEPHPAASVLEQQYGDCKDQTVLLIALLRAVGIEAHPAFINTYSDGYLLTSVPSLAFSHAIVFVPDENDPLWIDPSNDVAGFPGLHWTSRDRWAFVINGQGGELQRTPADPSIESRGTIREHSAVLETNSMRSVIEYDASGDIGELLKAAYLHSPERDRETTRQVRWMYPTATVTSVDYPGLHDPTSPFSMVAHVDVPIENTSNLDSFIFHGNAGPVLLFSGLSSLDDPHRRRNDFVVPYSFEWTHETLCAPPRPGLELRDTPERISVSYGPFSFETTYAPAYDGVMVRQRARLSKGRIPVDEYAALYSAVEKVKRESAWQVDFVRPDKLPESLRLERDLQDEGRSTVSLLRLARTLLGEGKHERALEVVDEALEIAPNLGEAHYLRGLASAYTGDKDASTASFEKARGLGYKP